MSRIGPWLAGAFAAIVVALGIVSIVVSRPQFDDRLEAASLQSVAIAPRGDALTFARTRLGDELHVLLVTAFEQGRVTGLDLGTGDPVALYREHGEEGILAAAADAATVNVVAAELDLPFEAHERNVGLGMNYDEHARESGIPQPPFLFPKYAQPTRADSTIEKRDAVLLDYEAELGLVLLDAVTAANAATARVGFVLANEVTDRWRLVRGLDRDQPMGTTGFADGKSRAGFAPLGPLLVIPRDAEAFYPSIELRLHLNGRLRQRESAGAMRWSPRRGLAELFNHARLGYAYQGQLVSLLGSGPPLPPGTVIFLGTPAGVIFRPANLWNPWVYLRPGDEIVVQGTYLGAIRNRVVD